MLKFVCLLIVCLTIVIEKESESGGERDKYMQTVVAVLCIVVALFVYHSTCRSPLSCSSRSYSSGSAPLVQKTM